LCDKRRDLKKTKTIKNQDAANQYKEVNSNIRKDDRDKIAMDNIPVFMTSRLE